MFTAVSYLYGATRMTTRGRAVLSASADRGYSRSVGAVLLANALAI